MTVPGKSETTPIPPAPATSSPSPNPPTQEYAGGSDIPLKYRGRTDGKYIYSKEEFYSFASHKTARTRPPDLDPLYCRGEPGNVSELRTESDSKLPLGRGRPRKPKETSWTNTTGTSPTNSTSKGERAFPSRKELKPFFLNTESSDLDIAIQDQTFPSENGTDSSDWRAGRDLPISLPQFNKDFGEPVLPSTSLNNSLTGNNRTGRGTKNLKTAPPTFTGLDLIHYEQQQQQQQLHQSGGDNSSQELRVPTKEAAIILSPPKKLFPSSQLKDKRLQQKTLEKRSQNGQAAQINQTGGHSSSKSHDRSGGDRVDPEEGSSRRKYSNDSSRPRASNNHSPKYAHEYGIRGSGGSGRPQRTTQSGNNSEQNQAASSSHSHQSSQNHSTPVSSSSYISSSTSSGMSISVDLLSPEQIAVSGENNWYSSSASADYVPGLDWLHPHLISDEWNENEAEEEEEEEEFTASRAFGRWFGGSFAQSESSQGQQPEEEEQATENFHLPLYADRSENTSSLLNALFAKQNAINEQANTEQKSHGSDQTYNNDNQDDEEEEQILFQGNDRRFPLSLTLAAAAAASSSTSSRVSIPITSLTPLQPDHPIFDLKSVDPDLFEPLEPENSTTLSVTSPTTLSATVSPVDSSHSLPSLETPNSYDNEAFGSLLNQHFSLSSNDSLDSLPSAVSIKSLPIHSDSDSDRSHKGSDFSTSSSSSTSSSLSSSSSSSTSTSSSSLPFAFATQTSTATDSSTSELLQKLFTSAAQNTEASLLPQLRALQNKFPPSPNYEAHPSTHSHSSHLPHPPGILPTNVISPSVNRPEYYHPSHDPSILSVSPPPSLSMNSSSQDLSWFQSLISSAPSTAPTSGTSSIASSGNASNEDFQTISSVEHKIRILKEGVPPTNVFPSLPSSSISPRHESGILSSLTSTNPTSPPRNLTLPASPAVPSSTTAPSAGPVRFAPEEFFNLYQQMNQTTYPSNPVLVSDVHHSGSRPTSTSPINVTSPPTAALNGPFSSMGTGPAPSSSISTLFQQYNSGTGPTTTVPAHSIATSSPSSHNPSTFSQETPAAFLPPTNTTPSSNGGFSFASFASLASSAHPASLSGNSPSIQMGNANTNSGDPLSLLFGKLPVASAAPLPPLPKAKTLSLEEIEKQRLGLKTK